ncbi:alpha/beta hydrolase [Vitiosangium sp. GDMCC 1.1324]|uniref:alpha/beta hydrolase n=1 Tax=Vitiosangium sp. (strain GDMCC 1.1324) TaxID=2138576 RepID=UPI000D338EBA|nr:alpha/beta fold hydrolase [Vitiosangium sp. GDMCC 1.1324]PTL84441.1 alpha/beta hydrolase [Vitiosangium sp. GDMCC 1.1324]
MSEPWMLETPAPPADARIPYGDDPHQFGDLRLPGGKGPHPVVVVVHGGFWRARYDLEHVGHLCADLTARGYATWSLEYRRVGHPGGGWTGTLEDAARGMDHLRALAARYPLDLERVVVLGHSAGGHLALWLAGRGRLKPGRPLYIENSFKPRGAVSLAGVADLARAFELRLSDGIVESFLGGTPAQVPERYELASPAALLPLGVKQVLVHGTDDDTVPLSVSTEYHARATKLGDSVRLVSLPGAGHFEVIDPRAREWPQVVEAVASLM